MAVQKPLQIVSGIITEVTAVESSAGSGDEGKIVALNASGLIDPTMLPASGSTTFTSSEAIAAGALVNIWNSTGVKVRNADNAAIGKQAHGYAPSAITSGATGTIVLGEGIITGLSGLTVGVQQFLGSAGAVTATPPTASASIVQPVGVAISASSLSFDMGPIALRA
jgi:hypothetical protein